jgi:hypothetical protein
MEIPKKKGRPKKVVVKKISEPIKNDIDSEEDITLTEHNNNDNENNDNDIDINDDFNDNFLNDFNNEHFLFIDPVEQKEKEKIAKESEKIMNKMEKNKKKEEKEYSKYQNQPKKNVTFENEELFSDKGSELLGKTKRELISKLQQYKSLFPKELKGFRVKKNATEEELILYLEEMEVIVNTSSVEQFITDSILHCIRLVEGGSTYTRYNIQGCADMLSLNPQFHNLSKMLYVKYKVFSAIPPEFQMIMLISTTAYICKCKNDSTSKYHEMLNQSI